jgi:hypothetical protein
MIPLQLSEFGAAVGVLFFVGSIVSIVVGGVVGYRALRGYRRTRQRSLLLFGVGLLLLVSVSKLVNIGLADRPGNRTVPPRRRGRPHLRNL